MKTLLENSTLTFNHEAEKTMDSILIDGIPLRLLILSDDSVVTPPDDNSKWTEYRQEIKRIREIVETFADDDFIMISILPQVFRYDKVSKFAESIYKENGSPKFVIFCVFYLIILSKVYSHYFN